MIPLYIFKFGAMFWLIRKPHAAPVDVKRGYSKIHRQTWEQCRTNLCLVVATWRCHSRELQGGRQVNICILVQLSMPYLFDEGHNSLLLPTVGTLSLSLYFIVLWCNAHIQVDLESVAEQTGHMGSLGDFLDLFCRHHIPIHPVYPHPEGLAGEALPRR